jgi:hypothetical protein
MKRVPDHGLIRAPDNDEWQARFARLFRQRQLDVVAHVGERLDHSRL